MSEGKGGYSTKKNARVWLLGRDHPSADRSLNWDSRFGNLSDPDVLIVDLTGLTEDVLKRIDKKNLDEASKSIKDKFLYGGIIIAITQPEFSIRPNNTPTGRPAGVHGGAAAGPRAYSNYQILPINISTTTVQSASVIRAKDGHCFKDYIDAVRGYDFLINMISARIIPDPTGMRLGSVYQIPEWDITNNSGHSLGFALGVMEADRHGHARQASSSGRLVLLPPPTEPIYEAIGKLLSVYKPLPPAGAPPAWAGRLAFGPAGRNAARIKDLERRRAEMRGEIDGLARQNGRILAHRRLLYSDGPELEDAVVETFRALEFDDIERMGDVYEEDASFGMVGSGTRYSRCAIEAKGAGKVTKMRDIDQCNRWAGQRAAAEGSPAKGVFVPNQHRLELYPDSLAIRTRIEPNQIEYAELKDICIIPSCALFEAVRRVLDGEAPDRAKIARKIAATRGVLADAL